MTIFASNPVVHEGFTVFARADRIEDDPSIHITDNATGEEVIVPLKFFPAFYRKADEVFSPVQEEQHVARYLANHPRNYDDTSLLFLDGEKVALAGADISRAGVPMLIWVRGVEIVKAVVYPRPVHPPYNPEDIPSERDEWRLVLSDDRRTVLDRATWDDPEGIQRLVDGLRDPEILNAYAVLADPDVAFLRVAIQTVEELDLNHLISPMSVPVIRDVISRFYLGDRSSHGRIWALNVPIKNRKVAIAVGIEIPKSTSTNRIRKVNTIAGNQIEDNLSWSDTLCRDVLALNDGWRFVDLPSSRDKIASQRSKNTLWLTRIPEETWSVVEPLARVLAEKTIPTGKYF
jgi:hypothetical protein